MATCRSRELNVFLFYIVLSFYVCECCACVHTCTCTPCASVPVEAGVGHPVLDSDFQMVGTRQAGARIQTVVLCRSNQCS